MVSLLPFQTPPQESLKKVNPSLGLLKITLTGYTRPGSHICQVVPVLPFQVSPRSCFALFKTWIYHFSMTGLLHQWRQISKNRGFNIYQNFTLSCQMFFFIWSKFIVPQIICWHVIYRARVLSQAMSTYQGMDSSMKLYATCLATSLAPKIII